MISGMVVVMLLNFDCAAFVLLIRFIKLRQNGTPSFDIWTGQSIKSTPSEIAF